MAEETALSENKFNLLPGLTSLPILQQLGTMVMFALIVGIAVALAMWTEKGGYEPLFNQLPQQEMQDVVDVLVQNKIDYKIDSTGTLVVPAGKVNEVKMMLAQQGLPASVPVGMQLLDQDQKFGTSRFRELKQYLRAIEGEIGLTISSLANVQSAKVHLAIPKESVFLRKKNKPTASVLVKMHAGRVLDKGQIQAIIHLVASSIPRLEPKSVTVVNHHGKLLNAEDELDGLGVSTKQFEYNRKVEQKYIDQIQNTLFPILGDGANASVTAVLDFTQSEHTQESYNPDMAAVRTEQIYEDSATATAAQGIPGALSNKPPGAGASPEKTEKEDGTAGSSGVPKSVSKKSSRTYALDKKISHVRKTTGEVRRLSIAVVVDDRKSTDAGGNVIRLPRTNEEMIRIKNIIKNAVGYDARRGDSIVVENLPFEDKSLDTEFVEPAFYESAEFQSNLTKVILYLVFAMIVLLGVVPPLKRMLATPRSVEAVAGAPALPGGDSTLSLPDPTAVARLQAPNRYDEALETAKRMVEDDPKRVAQLMKTWLAVDDA